jgi:hypothetical protein
MIGSFAPFERYTAWAVLQDGRSACHLGVIAPPPLWLGPPA